jgi:hypothetical protein
VMVQWGHAKDALTCQLKRANLQQHR